MLSQLKNIGLSDKEARVYLAMLELGPSSVMDIASKAGVNRPTAYVEIDSLKKKGLASTQPKGSKRLFAPESPEQLEFYLIRENQKMASRQVLLNEVLPELRTMFNLGEKKPVVRFFEGGEGLLKMQDEFLKAKPREILGIFSIDAVYKVFPKHGETYSPERVKRKIPARSIYTSAKGPILKKDDVRLLRKSKFVPPEQFKFQSDITIFGDSVAIAALHGKPSGTIIEQKEIADSFKGLFEFVWDLLD